MSYYRIFNHLMCMNRNVYMWAVVFVALLSGWLLQGCDGLDVDPFGEERALYFEKRIPHDNTWKYIDTAEIAVTNYPGQELIRHPFRICLIGDTLAEDAGYSLMIVDSLTTAREGMVTLPDQVVFRRGRVSDSLWLTIHAEKVNEGERFCITYRLVANGTFGVGYKGYQEVKLWFNNIESRPLWWDQRIEDVYLGTWSARKFEALVLATGGINTFEGLSATEMRLYALKLQEYIRNNGITEADGSPMVVPIY